MYVYVCTCVKLYLLFLVVFRCFYFATMHPRHPRHCCFVVLPIAIVVFFYTLPTVPRHCCCQCVVLWRSLYFVVFFLQEFFDPIANLLLFFVFLLPLFPPLYLVVSLPPSPLLLCDVHRWGHGVDNFLSIAGFQGIKRTKCSNIERHWMFKMFFCV